MNREEGIKMLKEVELNAVLSGYQACLSALFEKDMMGEKLLACLRQFMTAVSSESREQIRYLQISFLGTGAYQNKVEMIIEALGEKWIFAVIDSCCFELEEYHPMLEEIWQILNARKRVRCMLIEDFDITNIIYEQCRFLAHLSFASLKMCMENQSREICFSVEFGLAGIEIRCGEYRGDDYLIYSEVREEED